MTDRKTAFIEEELMHLWDDLWKAEVRSKSSDPKVPSMEMEWIMDRISWATSIVGPISWERVSLKALRSGRYEYWAEYMEIPCHLPPEAH